VRKGQSAGDKFTVVWPRKIGIDIGRHLGDIWQNTTASGDGQIAGLLLK
jgi:hypothetical protein